MRLMQKITSDSWQQQSITLPDGTAFLLQVYFSPMQFGWFIRLLEYGTFSVTNIRISNSPNILHQFKNQIPFGLACFSTDNREPTQQSDFSSGASKMYLLSEAEVASYAGYLSGTA